MPPFSFHRPRFLRSLRSPHAEPRDADVSHSPGLVVSPTSASCPSSDHSAHEESVNMASHTSAPGGGPGDSRIQLDQPFRQHSAQTLPRNQGMFNEAQDFSVTGTFVEGNVGSITHINTTSSLFMKEFLKETIPGAAFDSSARDPPPRCHPGTRLAILQRCIDFISNRNGEKKMRWVFGAAGVGKSAIMQNVAESPNLQVASQASVFFSVNGRPDGTKAIKTISYQLAAKCKLYRQVIEEEITSDPSLLQASMAVQFKKLIIEPFIHNSQLNSVGRVLVIIDGLDECNQTRTQQELLRLISDFCITYPSSPIVWLIASRPEPHITSFFARAKAIPAYEEEEILVDSDEARDDVERFLRHELSEIKENSDSLSRHSQWPEERDLWKIANAAGGLFAYADTATKYVGDSTIGDPTSQLSDVLHVINNHPIDNVPREQHPMALLDALYARILSNVPSKIMVNTRKLFLALTTDWGHNLKHDKRHFVMLCNWLALTPDEGYAAVNHLRSVLRVPGSDEAHKTELTPFHKSFIDYISDFNRSGIFRNIMHDAQQLKADCAFRILKEAPDGIDFGKVNYGFDYGRLKRGPGTGNKISLTWLVNEEATWNNNKTRLGLYKLAISQVVVGMRQGELIFRSEFCIRLLTTRLREYGVYFIYDMLCDSVFDKSRRHEFLLHEILEQTPLKTVRIPANIRSVQVKMQFRRPATTVTKLSDPWNAACGHERKGEWEEGKDQDWITTFNCLFCCTRLQHQVDDWKARYPNHTVPVLSTSTGKCLAEIQLVDEEDGIKLEWTYWVWYEPIFTKRKKYGTTK